MHDTPPGPAHRLLEALRPYQSVLIVAHDNPDPDAIASGWALLTLIRAKTEKPVKLLAGGEIIRAENRHMLRTLRPPLQLVDKISVPESTAILLVDCAPSFANHLSVPDSAALVGVVDHHEHAADGIGDNVVMHVDAERVACGCMTAEMLRECGLEPDERLATALVYAVRSETRSFEFNYTVADRETLGWLSTLANPAWLAEIESCPLTRAYFGDLVLALEHTTLYHETAFCALPQAEGPEIVGEVADLLIRCEDIRRVFCAAAWEDSVFISVRTQVDGDDAGQLVSKALEGIGYGGGHHHRAGGKIANRRDWRLGRELEETLRQRWLTTCGEASTPGVPLVIRLGQR